MKASMHRITRAPRRFAWVVVTGMAVASWLHVPVAGAQQLAVDKSAITFVVKQMGVPVEGSFAAFDAKLVFDPKKPEAGSVQLRVDLASAQIGDAETTRELRKPEWFDTAKHAAATFTSKSIKAAGPGRFDVVGTLKLKAGARDITVPVVLAQAGAQTTATGQFSLGRVDYKIGEGEWADTSIVANDVLVKFKLVLAGIAPM
jgi:polyisoprenoid-binding protein YceI